MKNSMLIMFGFMSLFGCVYVEHNKTVVETITNSNYDKKLDVINNCVYVPTGVFKIGDTIKICK